MTDARLGATAMPGLSADDANEFVQAVRGGAFSDEELRSALLGWADDPSRSPADRLAARSAPTLVPPDDVPATRPPSSPGQAYDPPRPATRFARGELHARGGLGAVFRAVDEELGRVVALKEIQDRHADDPASRSRFVFEAEVTGRLEHPGIVPVYGLGAYADGRPFYAMRFVQGRGLDEVTRRFHAADLPGRSLALRELLGRFVAACKAVAYAHSKGVIHRDLKPANVMAGDFGETLVVDWGLAKYVGRPEGQVTPVAPAAFGETAQGQAVGTPGYMPPEQWRGDHDRAGPASDVYALGATLYHLLTGEPPLKGLTLGEACERALAGRVPPAREVNPRVPAALEAVSQKAMAVDPAARYGSAGELAEEVERWLADEPVRAYREPLPTRVRRWAKRNRTLVTAAGVLLFAALAASGVGWWYRGEQRELRLAAVEAERVETAKQRDAAKANLDRAEANLKLAKKAIDDTFGLAKTHPLLQDERHRKVRELLLKQVLPYYQSFRDQRPTDRALASEQAEYLDRLGYIAGEMGRLDEARVSLEQSRRVRERLTKDHPEAAEYRSGLATTLNNLGGLYGDSGRAKEALDCYDAARLLQEGLVAAQPEVGEHRSRLAATLNNLGLLHGDGGRPKQALRCYESARLLQEQLVRVHPDAVEHRSRLAITLNNLGLLHRQAGRGKESVEAHEAGRHIQERLVRERPESSDHRARLATTLNNLGLSHAQGDRAKEALECYEQARRLRESLAKEQPEAVGHRAGLATTLNNLGNLHRRGGRSKEALECYQAAGGILEKLTKDHPEATAHRAGLATTFNNLALLHRQAGRREEAIESYELAARLFDRLAKDHPGTAEHRTNLAVTLYNLGALHFQAGENEQALGPFTRAVALAAESLKHDPDDAKTRNVLSNAHGFRAQALGKAGRHLDAVADWDAVIALEAEPGRLPTWRMRRAYALAHAGDHRSAAAAVERLAGEKALTPALAYDAACVRAICAAACAGDASRPLPEREKRAEELAREAVRSLGDCAAAGHFKGASNFALLKTDADLAFVRRRDDYRRWLAALEASDGVPR